MLIIRDQTMTPNQLKYEYFVLFLLFVFILPSEVVLALVSVTSRWHCSQVVRLHSHQFHLPAPAAKEKSANVFVSPWL